MCFVHAHKIFNVGQDIDSGPTVTELTLGVMLMDTKKLPITGSSKTNKIYFDNLVLCVKV